MSKALPFISPAFALGKLLFGNKPKAPQATPPITRNDAAEAARRSAEFRKRKGAGANELTGGGAEASSGGGKTLLGQ